MAIVNVIKIASFYFAKVIEKKNQQYLNNLKALRSWNEMFIKSSKVLFLIKITNDI